MVRACKAFPISKVLGSGTFGQVYLSEPAQGGKSSRTSNDFFKLEDALKEVDILRCLAHPNIVSFIDLIRRDNRFYIVMEYCGGGDLRDVLLKAINTRSGLDGRWIGSTFVQVLLALHHCHHSLLFDWTLLHRDLKPENVLLTQDGQVKLADFGLSTLLSGTAQHAHPLVGTPGYLAPEVMSLQPYGHKPDMFSLGCILYEMLTLVLPDTRTLLQGHSIWSGTLTNVSAEQRALISGRLAIMPEDRWSTADVISYGPVALWFNEGMSTTGGVIALPSSSASERSISVKEIALRNREEQLVQRSKDLRTRSRRLAAREAELEAKIRKFAFRSSKSPSVEPERPTTRARKVAQEQETKRKDAL